MQIEFGLLKSIGLEKVQSH